MNANRNIYIYKYSNLGNLLTSFYVLKHARLYWLTDLVKINNTVFHIQYVPNKFGMR